MNVLAIETSAGQGSLALSCDGAISSCLLEQGPAQSATALPRLGELLRASDIDAGQLDLIAFGKGPGMFTGLRLGCGLAQGLALGTGAPLLAVSSLQALAEQCPAERVIALADARMGELYCRRFERRDGELVPTTAAQCLPPEQLEVLPGEDRWCGIGAGFSSYRDRFSPAWLDRVDIIADSAVAHAREVLSIALRAHASGAETAAIDAVPEYVRNKVALTTRERIARGARA